MKRLLSALLLLNAAFVISVVHAAEQHLYLASGGKLTWYDIDPSSGELSQAGELEYEGVGPFTFSPDSKWLHAMLRKQDGFEIANVELLADGGLKVFDAHPVKYRSGYLMVDATGGYIAGNHYSEGKASLWRLKDGRYMGELVVELDLEPKAHSSIFSVDNRWLLVPATAPNKVFVNAFDATSGSLKPNDPPYGEGPSGEQDARHPRHLVFHPKLPNRAYTSNESKEPGVGVWDWDLEKGTIELIQNIVTRPDDIDDPMSTADLHFTPDGRYLYVSNRHTVRGAPPEQGRSAIVGFEVDPKDGRLSLIGHTTCENVPRSFCIDRSGRFLHTAGQRENRLGVYAIDPDSGHLEEVEQHEVGLGPIWVEAR
ncbi:MAG: beta-propeller fold lactonase family protein [Verrucomicrobiota bacterium]